MNIREIREQTRLTQREFAERLGIPIGTIRRWEYGESTPAPYIVKMIARELPQNTESMKKIVCSDGRVFYYDALGSYIIDEKGTKLSVSGDIANVKEANLPLYVGELFESYYDIIEKFNTDCRLDKSEDIIWS